MELADKISGLIAVGRITYEDAAANDSLEQAAELVEKHEAELAEKPVDYSTPTPQTDAFMILIDDSEVDLSMIESQLRDMEHERDHYKKLLGKGVK